MSGRDTTWNQDPALATGRQARAELVFAAGGGRTVLSSQHVPYPFHITRTFQLDGQRPDLATLYLQSSSGGLYRGDDLTLNVTARPGAHAHVTTQAATMVHDTGMLPARQRTSLRLETGSFLAYTPDPLVLFPGVTLFNETNVTLAADARGILFDGFAWHDPKVAGRPFGSLTQTLKIHDTVGRCLVHETGSLSGQDFLSDRSPLGPFTFSGSVFVFGAPDILPSPTDLQQVCDAGGCLSGVTDLPNGAGRVVRCLARDGRDLRHGLEAAFVLAFTALVGVAPAPRRK